MFITQRYLALLAVLFCLMATNFTQAQTTWDNLIYDLSSGLQTDLDSVTFYDDRTEVHLTASYSPGYYVIIDSITLTCNNQKYIPKTTKGFTFNQRLWMPDSGKKSISISYDALPKDTESFNLTSDHCSFTNIRLFKYAPKDITDFTYWRNNNTGNWDLALCNDKAIYNNLIWTISNKKLKPNGSGSFTITNNGISHIVTIGKEKKGSRSFTIGKEKSMTCSLINSKRLGLYPTADNQTQFVNNNYAEGDSVTITCWLKGRNKLINNNEIVVFISDFTSYKPNAIFVKIDDNGFFQLRLPIINTTEITIDSRCSNINLVVEPNKSYFILHDYNTAHKLVMGEDARVQNELLLLPVPDQNIRFKYSKENFDQFVSRAVKQVNDAIDNIKEQYPTLSSRYMTYFNNAIRCNAGEGVVQYSSYATNGYLTKENFDLITDEFITKLSSPLTLSSSLPYYLIRFNQATTQMLTKNKNMYDYIISANDNGSLQLTTNEIELAKALSSMQKEMETAWTTNEKISINKKYLTLYPDLNNAAHQLGIKCQPTILPLMNYDINMAKSSIPATAHFSDEMTQIYNTQEICSILKEHSQTLNEAMLNDVKANIKLPFFISRIIELNNELIKWEKVDISNSPCIKSNDIVAGLTDGSEILKKIIEPYKGKLILLDTWGAWCQPCMNALSHSPELFNALRQYDVVLLYMANRTPHKAWLNAIKMNKILADNVVHYNLPGEQQAAVEAFLKLRGYPSYFLFDRNGNIVPKHVDARDIPHLIEVISGL